MSWFHLKAAVGVVLCLAVACGDESDDGSTITPETGGAVTAEDGASATLPPRFGEGGVSMSLERTSDPQGKIADDRKDISAQYTLSMNGATRMSTDLLLQLPVVKSLLPSGWTQDALQPEYYDDLTKSWTPTGDFVIYTPESGVVAFNDTLPRTAKSAGLSFQLISGPMQVTRIYRIRVYLFSNSVTARKPNSNFRITYYPSKLGKRWSVPTNAKWGSKTGNAVDPAIPDYIEDLDAALNQAYAEMLKLKSAGGNLFKEISVPHEVVVTDLGGTAGSVKNLGGTINISSHKIPDWQDLRGVAAHELVHVLQGQHMSNIINKLFSVNRWFIEASANHYAARATKMSAGQIKTFYSKDGYADYLRVSLASPSDNSMYTAAHLLDWLATTYGSTVIGDALKAKNATMLTNLSTALKSSSKKHSLGEAYGAYGHHLLTHPDAGDKFNQFLKDRTVEASWTQGLSGQQFTDTRTHLTYKWKLEPLSLAMVELRAKNSGSALLVVDSSRTKAALFDSYTYDFVGQSNASYTGKVALDQFSKVPSTAPMTIKDFAAAGARRNMEQILINTSPASTVDADLAYYILIKPKVSQVKSGSVTFSTAGAGNIPASQIKGYNIYRTEGGGRVKLNSILVGHPGGTSQRSYANSKIMSDDDILVQVVDALDNKWPEVAETQGKQYACAIRVVTDNTISAPSGQGSYIKEKEATWIASSTKGSFTGQVFNVTWNGKDASGTPADGSITFTLDKAETSFLSFKGVSNKVYGQRSYHWEVEGKGLKKVAPTSAYPLLFQVDGTAACASITRLKYSYKDTVNPSANRDLTSYKCTADSLVLVGCN